jgi:hypothetical protein
MNTRNLENGLALLVAVLVFVAMTFAANSALADENGVASALVAENASPATDSKSSTRDTIRKAADAAADRIARDNKLDLEIRLIDRTSTIAARSL